MMKPYPAAVLAIAATAACATPTTVTFRGSIVDDGLFETIPVGTEWTLTVSLPGISPNDRGDGTEFAGTATFAAGAYTAEDASVVLSVLPVSGGSIFVRLSDPDATLPPLTFQGGGATGDPVEINLNMTNTQGPAVIDGPGLPASIDATDFEFTQLIVRVPLTLSPVGLVGSVEIVPGCDADLAEPFGVLNFFDLSAYVAQFTNEDPAADLASPAGVFNFFDIQAYLALFSAGCP